MSTLFTPVQIGKHLVKNRIALAPLTRNRCGESQVPSQINVDYYTQRAGAGIVITEATVISQQGNGWGGAGAIYNEDQIAGWKLVTDSVHAAGGVIFCQLWHMGRQTTSDLHGLQPVSASAIKLETSGHAHGKNGRAVPYEEPRALETSEIPTVVEEYRHAAECAKKAGFDGVEIHSANGYLLDQFLQTVTNHRTDQYGGSFENRYRLLREVLESILTVFPADSVAVRLSPNGAYGGMGSEDNFDLFSYVISELNQYKLAYLHVMDGLGFGFHAKCQVYRLFDVRKRYEGAIMGNCGYTKESAEGAINTGCVDMIAFGRPYISNPDLAERFQNNWPLAETAPYPTWWDMTDATGYSDWPKYTPPAPVTEGGN